MNIQEENSARYFRVQSEREQTLVGFFRLGFDMSELDRYYQKFTIVVILKFF